MCFRDALGLVVLVPGMGDGPNGYKDKGFIDIVRRTHPRFDVVAAEAHFGYYRDFRVLERLHMDVGELDTGVIILAPYLGGREIGEEVRNPEGSPRERGTRRIFALHPSNQQRKVESASEPLGVRGGLSVTSQSTSTTEVSTVRRDR